MSQKENKSFSSFDLDLARDAANNLEWQKLLEMTSYLEYRHSLSAEEFFFRGMAFLRLGKYSEADRFITLGHQLDPASTWGSQLEFETNLALGRVDLAFERLAGLIDSVDDTEAEAIKNLIIMRAVDYGKFDLAKSINETRAVINKVRRRPRTAVCLQFFNKYDTLLLTLKHLCEVVGGSEFSLVCLQDSYLQTVSRKDYKSDYENAQKAFFDTMPKLLQNFYSVELMTNDRNLGTAPTCRRLIDSVCDQYESFIFLEDDCLLSKDALTWLQYHLSNNINENGPWFVTAESIFFDKQNRSIDDEVIEAIKELSKHRALRSAHTLLNFVPSTCFGSTASIWNLCKYYRSFTRGPESLTAFLQTQGRKTISPIVPRASDIGMQHTLGYSVQNLGAAHVRESKSTLLLSGSPFDASLCFEYQENLDLLYSATCLGDRDRLLEMQNHLDVP